RSTCARCLERASSGCSFSRTGRSSQQRAPWRTPSSNTLGRRPPPRLKLVLSFFALNRARVRLELNTRFKSDIVGDLYWSVNVFESYNGAPPAGQKSNDSGVSAAIGWSF